MSEVTNEVAVEQPVVTGSLLDTAVVPTEEHIDVPTEEVPVEEVVERPEWLPEGFETADELVAKYNELTNPVIPEDYEVTVPEGVEFNFVEGDNGIDGFKAIAKEMGMSQENFNKLIGFYTTAETNRTANDIAARQEASIALLGSNAQARLNNFTAKAKGTLSADEFELLQRATSNSNDAAGAAIVLLEKYMIKSEHNPVTQVNVAPRLTEGELKEMMQDPKYKTDVDYRKKVSEGFKALYT